MHAVRPTGGAWSNVNDLLAYVRLELAGGLLDNGRRYISESALKARWAPQIGTGRHSWYGMGLETSVASGTPLLFHGGRLYGQRGDMIWLPEHDVGAVILMNSSTGNVLMEAFPRKLLEVLFDGRPEADSMVAAAAAADREQRSALRRSLRFPADRDHVAMLAPRYRNEFLGELRVERSDGADGVRLRRLESARRLAREPRRDDRLPGRDSERSAPLRRRPLRRPAHPDDPRRPERICLRRGPISRG